MPRALLPFPPLPALVLLPFVAVFGLATDDQLRVHDRSPRSTSAICWWMLGRLPVDTAVRLLTTLFFAFGTTFWYAAQLGDDVVPGAHRGGRAGDARRGAGGQGGSGRRRTRICRAMRRPATMRRGPAGAIGFGSIARQFVAGLLFGLAATARLTVVFAAPFFMLVGGGGGWWRRSWSAGLGALIPVGLLLAYNLGTTGHLLHPAYDDLYRRETASYPTLGYRADWAVEDPRYLPGNAAIMFLTGPELFPTQLPDSLGVRDDPVCTEPGAERGLFDIDCPLAVPRDIGMSVLLTSPVWLLGLAALRRYGRSRLVTGAAIATVVVVVVNLMHFSQGWVQFGYRFSLDAAPFALVLVAVGLQRLVEEGRRWAMPVAAALLVVSIAVNAWGVAWGRMLGW